MSSALLKPPPPTSPYHRLPLTALPSIILSSGPLIILWTNLTRYVTRSGPIPLFRYTTIINSIIYSLFSGLVAYLLFTFYTHPTQTFTLPFKLPKTFASSGNTLILTPATLGYIYHVSKIYEYIDIFNLVGQGIVITPHMAFHHIVMPYLTWFRIISMPTGATSWPAQHQLPVPLPSALYDILTKSPDWIPFALINTMHHTIMYAYFGHLGNWLRYVIPVTGWLQLTVGIGVDVLWMVETNGGKRGLEGVKDGEVSEEMVKRGLTVLVLARFAMLYWEERKMVVEKDREREERGKRKSQ